jgi:hypothetical protein
MTTKSLLAILAIIVIIVAVIFIAKPKKDGSLTDPLAPQDQMTITNPDGTTSVAPITSTFDIPANQTDAAISANATSTTNPSFPATGFDPKN